MKNEIVAGSKLIDLTVAINRFPENNAVVVEDVRARTVLAGKERVFRCHRLQFEANSGTHVCFPNHLQGSEAEMPEQPLDMTDFWRVPTTVLHVVPNASGAVTAQHLKTALGECRVWPHLLVYAVGGAGVKIEAGALRPWLAGCAADWLLDQPFRTLICNVLEPDNPPLKSGICPRLYEAGRSLVFAVRNGHLLSQQCRTSILPLCVDGVSQMPCRVLAEI